MTKEEIKKRASQLHTTSYHGINMVTLTCATTFAEHMADLTMQEILEDVCKTLDDMGVVSQCVIDELYSKVKTKYMQ